MILDETQHSNLDDRYKSLRRRIGRLRTSNYDISTTCNLACEGCLFFSGATVATMRDNSDAAVWDSFFESEAKRKINFAYIGGAEPSLVPERIRACFKHIPRGVIFSNGIKKISTDIDYRIHVSLWGNSAGAKLYRGADNNSKALRNYDGDCRAVFVMTVNALNLDEMSDVAAQCANYDVLLTFSLFSPTEEYNALLSEGVSDESRYVKFSTNERNMRLTETDLSKFRKNVLALSEIYPDMIRYEAAYLNWLTQPGSLYTLDEDGVALDCGNRLSHWHRHFNADTSQNNGKCCSPNISCHDCRPYAQSLATYLLRGSEGSKIKITEDWLRVREHWADIFLQ